MGHHKNIAYTAIMRRINLKNSIWFWGLAVLVFAFLSLVNSIIFNGLRENNTLLSRNESERRINDFLASLRDINSLAEAKKFFEGNTLILGLGAYSTDNSIVFRWGTAPEYPMKAEDFPQTVSSPPPPRKYIPNGQSRSLIIIQQRRPKPPGDIVRKNHDGPIEGERAFFLNHLLHSDKLYWEISQPVYWQHYHFYQFLFPFTEVVLAFLVVYVLSLVRKNSEYRRRIEEQKNLVVLGTAASTLAHEIKNPLSAIRLQTGILEHTFPHKASHELGIINEEVDRLTMLTHHVNDYLRDAVGNPESLHPAAIIREISLRILAKALPDHFTAENSIISFDAERFRSVMENLLLNALESGSPVDAIEIGVEKQGGMVHIEVRDRGRGIAEKDLERIFDPFFTTKSRGTGVGLTMVKRFIQARGGKLTVENRPGGGAVSIIDLPEYKA